MNIKTIHTSLLALVQQATDGALTVAAIDELVVEVQARLDEGADKNSERENSLRGLYLLATLQRVRETLAADASVENQANLVSNFQGMARDMEGAFSELKAGSTLVEALQRSRHHRTEEGPEHLQALQAGQNDSSDGVGAPKAPPVLADVIGGLRAACEAYESHTFRWRHPVGRVTSAVLKIILDRAFGAELAENVELVPAQILLLDAALSRLGAGLTRSETQGISVAWADDAKKRQTFFTAAVNAYVAYQNSHRVTVYGEDRAIAEDMSARVGLLVASEAYRQSTYYLRHKDGHRAAVIFQEQIANPATTTERVRELNGQLLDGKSPTRRDYMDAAIADYLATAPM